MLHALRAEVGDTVFFEILPTYVERFGGGHASTEDFIALAEEMSGMELDELFADWLLGGTMPPLPDLA